MHLTSTLMVQVAIAALAAHNAGNADNVTDAAQMAVFVHEVVGCDFDLDLFRFNEATQAVFRLRHHCEVSQFRFLPIKI